MRGQGRGGCRDLGGWGGAESGRKEEAGPQGLLTISLMAALECCAAEKIKSRASGGQGRTRVIPENPAGGWGRALSWWGGSTSLQGLRQPASVSPTAPRTQRGTGKAWLQSLALTLSGCVTLSKSLNLSGP